MTKTQLKAYKSQEPVKDKVPAQVKKAVSKLFASLIINIKYLNKVKEEKRSLRKCQTHIT